MKKAIIFYAIDNFNKTAILIVEIAVVEMDFSTIFRPRKAPIFSCARQFYPLPIRALPSRQAV